MLNITSHVIGSSTRPQLQSSWFSASYWRMAAIALLLTIPFLVAACVQAVLRSDLAMIGQAALGYLPLAVLAIMVAAPVTALLLAASDELCALISSAAGSTPSAALGKLALGAGATTLSGSTFVALVVGLLMVAATLPVGRAADPLGCRVRDRADAAGAVRGARVAGPPRLGHSRRRVTGGADPVRVRDRRSPELGASADRAGHIRRHPGRRGSHPRTARSFSPWAVIRLIPLHELAAGAAAWTPHLRHPIDSAVGPAADRTESMEGAPAMSPGGEREVGR